MDSAPCQILMYCCSMYSGEFAPNTSRIESRTLLLTVSNVPEWSRAARLASSFSRSSTHRRSLAMAASISSGERNSLDSGGGALNFAIDDLILGES